jgi:hypothetical protein
MEWIVQRAKEMLQSIDDGRAVVEWLRTEFDDPESRAAKGLPDTRSVASLHSMMMLVRKAFDGCTPPPSLVTFKLSKAELIELKRGHERAQVLSNEHLITIPDATKLLRQAEELLETATPTHSNPRLLLPLMLVSGRRLTELTSPRTVYESVDGWPHYIRIAGLLKKRGGDDTGCFPLLVPYTLFEKALLVWRAKQCAEVGGGVRRSRVSVDALDNKKLKARYAARMNEALAHNCVLTLPQYHCYKQGKMRACHNHSLRAIYVRYVFEMFACDESFARAAMRSCCHDSIAESLSYSHVHLQGCEAIRDTLGPLLKAAAPLTATAATPPTAGAGTEPALAGTTADHPAPASPAAVHSSPARPSSSSS